MDLAMSVVEKSSFGMASSKEDCVLISQKLKEYSRMSFPFDPGATQLFVDGSIQPTTEFLPSFIYHILMQLEAVHHAHIIDLYQLKAAPLMCAYLGDGNPIVQPTPQDLIIWQSKNNVASASFLVCINLDCLVTVGTFLKYYSGVLSLYMLLSVAISHVEYTLRDFLGAANYLEPWSLNVVRSPLSLTDSTGTNSMILTLIGHIQHTPSNFMNQVWDPGLQWKLLVMVCLRQLSKELGEDVMQVLGLQVLQGNLGSWDAIVELLLFKHGCILQLESALSFVVYETMVYVFLEDNIGILGQYKVCVLHWTELCEFPQDKKASKRNEENSIVWDPGNSTFVLSYLSIDQEINEVNTTCFGGEYFNSRLVMYGLLITYFMKLHQNDKADCVLTELCTTGLITCEAIDGWRVLPMALAGGNQQFDASNYLKYLEGSLDSSGKSITDGLIIGSNVDKKCLFALFASGVKPIADHFCPLPFSVGYVVSGITIQMNGLNACQTANVTTPGQMLQLESAVMPKLGANMSNLGCLFLVGMPASVGALHSDQKMKFSIRRNFFHFYCLVQINSVTPMDKVYPCICGVAASLGTTLKVRHIIIGLGPIGKFFSYGTTTMGASQIICDMMDDIYETLRALEVLIPIDIANSMSRVRQCITDGVPCYSSFECKRDSLISWDQFGTNAPELYHVDIMPNPLLSLYQLNVVLSVLLYLNLEDKVLIDEESIVMNGSSL